MSQPARTWALTLWALLVAALIVASMIRPGPGMEDVWPWAGGLLAFPAGAWVVLQRLRGNTIGRLLAFVATAAGLDFGLSWVAVVVSDHRVGAYAESLTIVPAVGIFAGILGILHLFPTGRPVGPRHRVVVIAMAAWMAIGALLGLVAPGPTGFSGRDNAFGVAPQWVTTLFDGIAVGLPVFAALGIAALVVRRRRAGPIERAQLQWFFAGAAMFAPVLLIVVLVPESDNRTIEFLLKVGAMLAFWSLPAAIVVAIVRYHLYDIDRLVSRTVSYVIVAGVLTAAYAVCIVSAQTVLPGGSQLGVAASTLAVAGLFAPVRSRVQHVLDRRFNRARYEAGAVTEQFARRLQQQIDLESIESDFVYAVDRTLQPQAVQLWLTASAPAPTASR